MKYGSRAIWPVVLGVILAMSLVAGCSQQSGTRNTGNTGNNGTQDQTKTMRLEIVEQWLESAHARPVTSAATEEGCKNCHDGATFTEAGGGFVPRFEPGAGGSTGTTGSAGTTGTGDSSGTAGGGSATSADAQEPRDWVVAMDCRVCHTGVGVDIADKGSVEKIPSLDTAKGGLGAVCMACHNGWHKSGVGREGNAAAPHYSVQTDMLFGVNTMAVPASQNATGGATQSEEESVSPHAKVRDTCVGCHVTGASDSPNHTFRVENFKGCQRSGCHDQDMTDGGDAKEDYDGDGTKEKVTAEIDGLMETLKQAIVKSAGITAFKSERGNVVFVGGKQVDVNSPEYAAAYNYLFVQKDKSRGIHNARFTVKLLKDSIAAVQ